MAVGQRDRKLLWAHSGALCAMCRAPLTAPPSNGDPAVILGEECHIVAQSQGGPRNSELPPGVGIDSYPNLILLCAADHRRIDAQPRTYTAAHLHEIKRDHEAWVHAQLTLPRGVSRHVADEAPPSGADALVSGVDALEESLRRHAALRYGWLHVPDLSLRSRVPIDELYVPPPFEIDGGDRPTLYDQLARETFRVVILGHPGAGKSTLAQKLCFDLATDSRPLIGGLRPVGILLSLRAIVPEMTQDVQPVEALRAALDRVVDLQLQAPEDPQALEHLLITGRLAPVFDGLDEVPTAEDRRHIHDALGAFAARYPQAPVIVTSRLVGYEHAPLASLGFRRAVIGEFGETQIRAYAERWFRSTTYDDGRARRLADTFLLESAGIPDLRSSPLLLGLLCTLYRGKGYLERSRADIYEQCAELLFEHWDRVRGVVPQPERDWFRPAIRRVAWQMLTNPVYAQGVTAEVAAAEITEYFVAARYADRADAATAARSLLDFCVGRAWVFTEIGTNPEGEGIFQFTHRTFLEYFAAEYLCSTAVAPGANAAAVLERLRAGDQTVPLLVAHLTSRRVHRGLRELLAALRDVALGPNDVRAIEAFGRRVAELEGPRA
jgi:hypothetical protein